MREPLSEYLELQLLDSLDIASRLLECKIHIQYWYGCRFAKQRVAGRTPAKFKAKGLVATRCFCSLDSGDNDICG